MLPRSQCSEIEEVLRDNDFPRLDAMRPNTDVDYFLDHLDYFLEEE